MALDKWMSSSNATNIPIFSSHGHRVLVVVTNVQYTVSNNKLPLDITNIKMSVTSSIRIGNKPDI